MATTFLQVKNRAKSTLAAGISDVDLSLTVAAGEGAKFPQPGNGFHITIDDEILKCTARSTDTLTVTRAQEGTAAAAHSAGASVQLRITAKLIQDLMDALIAIDPNLDGVIELAELASAVCSETEAVAKVTFENLNAKGDVGTGADQVAAGNHTHTLVEDLVASAKSTRVSNASGGGYLDTGTIGAGADYDMATTTQTFATGSRAVGVGFCTGRGYGSPRLRLYMAGVQVAKSAAWSTNEEDMYILIATRALSGSQTCKITIHSYSGGVCSVYGADGNNFRPLGAGVAVGSIKV